MSFHGPLEVLRWVGFVLAAIALVGPRAFVVAGEPESESESEAEGRRVRVASISFRPIKLDLAGNARRLEHWFRQAADGGARIAVAPEGALDGYAINEIVAGELSPEQLKAVSLSLDSPTIGRFRELAKELAMCLVFGFAEQADGDIYNTAVFIDDAGAIRGTYQKMQFAEGYDPDWWFNRLGERSRAFDTPFGRCGILICNDRWNPQLARIPALDGAQFLVIPSFGSTSKKQDDAVLARGVENGLPVIEANVGVSLIVSKDRIAAVDRREDGVTFAEIVIPGPRAIDRSARDREEDAFLRWRNDEMPKRLAKRRQQLVERESVGRSPGERPKVHSP